MIKIISSILLLTLAYFIINAKALKPLEISKEESSINLNSNFANYFSSPAKLLTTDLLWITTLMESDIDHYKGKDLNSWLYHRFNTITELDQKFLEAYTFGGQYLSIVKDDLLGASAIYEKGLKVYPNNYDLLSGGAFLYAFELEDNKRAIELYEKVVKFKNAPGFYQSILTKLKIQEGMSYDDAFKYLYSIYDKLEPGMYKTKLENDLLKLKNKIDIGCLNKRDSKCD